MITEYIAEFEEHGVVAPDDLPRAIDQLLQMQQAVDWWIEDHTVDVDNNLGGVDTVEDPSRKKRMTGMKKFKTFLSNEIHTFQTQQRRQTKDDGSEGDITTEITEKKPGFLVLERKYTATRRASSRRSVRSSRRRCPTRATRPSSRSPSNSDRSFGRRLPRRPLQGGDRTRRRRPHARRAGHHRWRQHRVGEDQCRGRRLHRSVGGERRRLHEPLLLRVVSPVP